MSTSPQTSEVWQISRLVPYWRNPRRVHDEAVNALMESIKAFGYNQPIVVDAEGVIIIGHTRYAALRRMGVEEVAVKVASNLTQQQVKQLRVIDNRTSEYSSWDLDMLLDELGKIDSELTLALFSEITTAEEENFGPSWGEQMAEAQNVRDKEENDVEFVCPSCFHGWVRNVTRDDVLSGRITGDASA